MIGSDSFQSNGQDQVTGTTISQAEAFAATKRAFTDLEAMGVSGFDIFNALADLFYSRGESEISQLLADTAYQCFQRGE
jgi:hypothetical protein